MLSRRQPRSPSDRTQHTTDGVGPFEYRFAPRTAASVRVARHVLASWLRALPDIDADRLDDLLVVASELLTNAAEHSSRGDGSVAMRGGLSGDAFLLEVEDDGEGFSDPRVIDLRTIDHAGESGRGLYIVRTIVDDVVIERASGATVVRCRKNGVLHRSGHDVSAAAAPLRSPTAGRRG